MNPKSEICQTKIIEITRKDGRKFIAVKQYKERAKELIKSNSAYASLTHEIQYDPDTPDSTSYWNIKEEELSRLRYLASKDKKEIILSPLLYSYRKALKELLEYIRKFKLKDKNILKIMNG